MGTPRDGFVLLTLAEELQREASLLQQEIQETEYEKWACCFLALWKKVETARVFSLSNEGRLQ
jgi:hypothetical protein